MGLYLGKEKINNLSVGYTTLGITDISDETTINISGILKGENNKIVSATPGVDYVIPGDSTVTSVNGQTGAVILSASDIDAQSTITVNGILKGDGAGGIGAAVPGTDYLAESDVVYCYITKAASGTDFVSSMTSDEIHEAVKSGKLVYAVDSTRMYPVVKSSITISQFSIAMLSGNVLGYQISAAGVEQIKHELQDSADKVKSVSAESTDTQYPSAKAVWDALIERVPSVTAADNGKFLRVVNGAWAAAEIANANGGNF